MYPRSLIFSGSKAGAHASLFPSPIRPRLPLAMRTDAKAGHDYANHRLRGCQKLGSLTVANFEKNAYRFYGNKAIEERRTAEKQSAG